MPEPMYRRIADDLQRKIETGQLGPGDQLPTEVELGDQYRASRNTIRDAVKWLVGRGLVETRLGQGTFVVEKIDPFVIIVRPETGFGLGEGGAYASEVTERRRTPKESVPRVEVQQAKDLVASELELGNGSTVISRHQQRTMDGTAWSLQTSFYPMRFVEQGATDILVAKNIDEGVINYLARILGVNQAGWRDKITVRALEKYEANFFKLPEDSRVAVFEIHRTSFDESGQPIRLTVTVYPADRNQFVINVGHVPNGT
jgi:GntR family transcriptional regulator